MNNVFNYIAKDIQNKMMRFGIVADFHTEEAFDYANRPFIKVVSSNFIIQPMIFKDIRAEGRVHIILSKEGNEQQVSIQIVIGLRYNHWNGGSNGFDYIRFEYILNSKDYQNGNPRFFTIKEQFL